VINTKVHTLSLPAALPIFTHQFFFFFFVISSLLLHGVEARQPGRVGPRRPRFDQIPFDRPIHAFTE